MKNVWTPVQFRLWPFSTLGWPIRRDLEDFYPTFLLITVLISFFCVARMMMMGI